MVQRAQLYRNFWEAYKRAYPTRPKDKLQVDFNKEWDQMKIDATDDSALDSAVQKRIQFLQTKATEDKSSNILRFFKKSSSITSDRKHSAATPPSNNDPPASSSNSTTSIPRPRIETVRSEKPDTGTDVVSDGTPRPTPSQDASRKRIMSLQTKITNLVGVRDIGFGNDSTEHQLKKFKKELSTEETALKKKERDAERKKKSRETQKIKIKQLCEKYPDVRKDLKFRDSVTGRPRIEVDQPDILNAIIDIATFGGAADERRRTESTYYLDVYSVNLSIKL